MKKFSRFITTIAVFVTVFAFSCIPSFAASVSFNTDWGSSTYVVLPSAGVDTPIRWDFYLYDSNTTNTITGNIKGLNSTNYFYNGYCTCGSSELVPAGYEYSGNMNVDYDLNVSIDNSTIDTTKFNYRVDIYPYKVSLILGDQEIEGSFGAVGDAGDFWMPFSGVHVTTPATRMKIRIYYTAQVWIYNKTDENNYFNMAPHINVAMFLSNKSFGVTGTTTGFNDNLGNFNDSMTEGSQKENNLTDKALGDLNSFEFKDIKDDSSILSSLTFYSSVINLAYGSLGSTIQTLFAVSFGVLIVIFILRIRRDSS